MDWLTTISCCPAENHWPSTSFTFFRSSSPSGPTPRSVTFVTPVPSLRGRFTTTTHSPETNGSPWLSLAIPGSSLRMGSLSFVKPPASSEVEPLRITNTLSGSPLATKAFLMPARSIMRKTAVITVNAIPNAVISVRPLRKIMLRTL